MHPCSDRFIGCPLPFDQRQVQAVAGLVAKSMGREFAKGCLNGATAYFFDQRIIAAAVRDQIGNGANL